MGFDSRREDGGRGASKAVVGGWRDGKLRLRKKASRDEGEEEPSKSVRERCEVREDRAMPAGPNERER